MTRKRKLQDIGRQKPVKLPRLTHCESTANSVDKFEDTKGKHEPENEENKADVKTKHITSISNEEKNKVNTTTSCIVSKEINNINTQEKIPDASQAILNLLSSCDDDHIQDDGTIRCTSNVSRVSTQNKGLGLDPIRDKPAANKDLTCLKRDDSGYTSGSEDESDIITAIAIDTKQQTKPPDAVDGNSTWRRYAESSPIEKELFRFEWPSEGRVRKLALSQTHRKPDCASQIYIQHEYATDNPTLGDLFGATLATYRWKKDGHVYFQHFLTDVQDGTPASTMKIENWDELVLLNDAFVPNLSHEDIQEVFTRVKVDSHTRLTLIIRRISLSVNKHNKAYAWYKTSAILIPEFPREPKAKELRYEPVTGGYDHRFWARMHGRDGALCLTVTQDDVTMQQLCSPDDDDPRDNPRKICVWCKVLEDPTTGLLKNYVLSLFGYHTLPDPEPFVAIDMRGVACVSKGQEFWYDFRSIGSQYYIKFEGQYLGYDGTNKVGLQKDEQYFVMRGTDIPNSSVQSHDSMDCSDLSNTSGSSHMSRDLSMDSDLSSKSDSAHMIQPDWSADLTFHDDAVDGFSSADLPQGHAMLSSSLGDSMSSGYITSSPPETLQRVTRSMSRQQTVTSPMENLSLDQLGFTFAHQLA